MKEHRSGHDDVSAVALARYLKIDRAVFDDNQAVNDPCGVRVVCTVEQSSGSPVP